MYEYCRMYGYGEFWLIFGAAICPASSTFFHLGGLSGCSCVRLRLYILHKGSVGFLKGKMPNGVLPYAMTCVRRRSFVHHKVSGSYISWTVWPRSSKFFTNIHTNVVCCYTGYDVTSCFWSAIKYCTKCVKQVRSAKSLIVRPLFKLESQDFTRTSMPTY